MFNKEKRAQKETWQPEKAVQALAVNLEQLFDVDFLGESFADYHGEQTFFGLKDFVELSFRHVANASVTGVIKRGVDGEMLPDARIEINDKRGGEEGFRHFTMERELNSDGQVVRQNWQLKLEQQAKSFRKTLQNNLYARCLASEDEGSLKNYSLDLKGDNPYLALNLRRPLSFGGPSIVRLAIGVEGTASRPVVFQIETNGTVYLPDSPQLSVVEKALDQLFLAEEVLLPEAQVSFQKSIDLIRDLAYYMILDD